MQEDVCVKSAGRQYIDSNCRVVDGNSTPQLFSAWDVLHRCVRFSAATCCCENHTMDEWQVM